MDFTLLVLMRNFVVDVVADWEVNVSVWQKLQAFNGSTAIVREKAYI
jgi:hypothetical protein